MSAGTVSVGTPSNTFTPNDRRATLLAASLAVQVTECEPIASSVPEAGSQLTFTLPLTLSIPVALYVTTAPLFESASTAKLLGTRNVGSVVSRTTTEKVCCCTCPLRPAEHATVCVPIAKTDPDRGEQVKGSARPVASFADAL